MIWTSFWTVTSLPFAFATPDAKQDHRLQNFLATTSNRNDWTRLMLAIIEGVEAVKQVLEGGVDINIRGVEPFQGMTPLAFASRIGSLETVRLLVERGGRVNDSDQQGHTALIRAAQEGEPTIVRLLLDSGADPSARTNQNWGPLTFAAYTAIRR